MLGCGAAIQKCGGEGTSGSHAHSSKRSTDSSARGGHELSRAERERRSFRPRLANCRSVLSRTARHRRRTVGAKCNLTPTRAHLHSRSLFCHLYFHSQLFCGKERRKKLAALFSCRRLFSFPFFLCIRFTCNAQRLSPTCWKRDTRARSDSTFGARKRRNHRDESMGAVVTLTRHGSQREPSSARGCLFFLFFFCFLLFMHTFCRRRKATARHKNGGGDPLRWIIQVRGGSRRGLFRCYKRPSY